MNEDSDFEFFFMEGEPDYKDPLQDNWTVAYTPKKSMEGLDDLAASPGSATKPMSMVEAGNAEPRGSCKETTAIVIEESPLKIKVEAADGDVDKVSLQSCGSAASLDSREDSQVGKSSPPSSSKKDNKEMVLEKPVAKRDLQKQVAQLKRQLAARTDLVACCYSTSEVGTISVNIVAI